MSTTATIQLTGIGGVPPYTFQVVHDASTTITNPFPTLQGPNQDQLFIDASNFQPGSFTIHVRIIDNNGAIGDLVVPVNFVDPGLLQILNVDINFQPVFPQNFIIPLQANVPAGAGPVTWGLIPSVTTLPGVSIDQNNNLVFSVSTFGSWTVGLQVKDSLGNIASKVLFFQVVTSAITAPTDGQVEILVNVPPTKVGTHQFTLTVQDSNTTKTSNSFNYQAKQVISDIRIPEAFFDHYWGAKDNTSIVFPILGSFSGFGLGTATDVVAANGLIAHIDNVNNVVKVSGPPTSFRNSEIIVALPIQQGNQNVALISRTFTLLAHNNSSLATDIGTVDIFTRPYIVGDFVGLNPQKPWVNSANIFKNTGWIGRVQNGSLLPPGLSLDANTALIYGTLVGVMTSTTTSVIEYVDNTGTVHGTVTIHWDTQSNDFLLVDDVQDLTVQTNYPVNSQFFSPTSQVPLTSVSVYRGHLPNGLTAQINNTTNNVDIIGVPTEAGYFDIWFRAINSNGQNSFLFKRLVVDYVLPLVILTQSLPTIVTGQSYSTQLQATGGTPPYTWSSPQWPGGINSTFPGLTLNAGSGLISGSTTAPNNTTQNDTFTVTDSNGVQTSAVLTVAVNNALRISTQALPLIQSNQPYSFSMTAIGGVPPYTWSRQIGDPALPSGITFNSSGVFSGVTSQTSYSQTLHIVVTDNVATSVTKAFILAIGIPTGLQIDATGVGPIDRGANYQGVLRAFGTFTAPVQWQVTPDSPNPLPTGLNLNANSADNGVTATIAGVYTGPLLNGYSVKVSAVDSNGNSALAFLLLTTTTSLHVTTTSLPPGVISGSYSFQLQAASNGIPSLVQPFVWALDGSSPALPSGYSISSSGIISGVTGAAYNQKIVVKVSNALSPADSATATLNLIVQNSTLAITTASLPNVTSGRPYTTTLQATGGQPFGSPANSYRWSVSPNSANTLPTGLTLDTQSGTISGTTTFSGFNKPIIFRVTDSIGAFVDKSLNLQVIAGLTLQSGIAFEDNIQGNVNLIADSNGLLGQWTFSAPMFFNSINGKVAGGAWEVQGTGSPSGFVFNKSAIIPVTPGQVLTFSAYFDMNTGTIVTGNVFWAVEDPGLTTQYASVTWSAGQTGRKSQTFTVPGGVTQVVIVADTNNATLANGLFVFFSNPQLEVGTTASPYQASDGNAAVLGFVSKGNVDSINPRPNKSFYVVATGVVSTTPAGITVTVGTQGITPTVESVSNGVAFIKLSGNFQSFPAGMNNLSVSVTDSGVNTTAVFNWTVYNDGSLRVVPLTGPFPQQLL